MGKGQVDFMIVFTEDLKIGVPHIDLQHKSLIDFGNKTASLCASNPSKEQISACLDFLGDYVFEHFSDEEKLQLESAYPRFKQHRDIHHEFVRTFKSLCFEFEKYGPSEKFANDLTNRVFAWIITHIQHEDIIFGNHYMKVKSNRLKSFLSE